MVTAGRPGSLRAEGRCGRFGRAGSGAGAGSAAASGAVSAGGSAGASAPSETTAITVPTSTVSPSGTRISVIVPLAGDGTSESTLSVETSNSTSSWLTVSPTDLNHRVMVPSVTVSPSWGISIWATGRQLLKLLWLAEHSISRRSAERHVTRLGRPGGPRRTLGSSIWCPEAIDARNSDGDDAISAVSDRSGPARTRRRAHSWWGGAG